ncbi:MAG TPA: endolytic transglycosylase MltG, partial [candidate division WWE3 bacterium]|nr:endolytic transglycosylase MltG [candidate division WWE3 bacterium]
MFLKGAKILGVIFLLGLVVVFFLFSVISNTLKQKPKEDLKIEIKPGATKRQALEKVFDKYDINPKKQTLLLAYFYFKPEVQIHAGQYSISKNTPLKEGLDSLKGGTFEESITFLEGWTVEENAVALKKIKGKDFAKEYYLKAKPLIGKLYPDTYKLDLNTTPINLIDRQNQTFLEKTKDLPKRADLDNNEVLILASIVEREARSDEDKKIIAGILIKRYQNDLPLDADATSQYGLAQKKSASFIENCIENDCQPYFWKNNLDLKDIKDGDEYNTRGKLGLPPTPICNPSLKSLQAVLKPQKTDFLYYLTDSKGKTHYARTLKEH